MVICHVGSTMAGPEPEHDFEHRHLPGARFVSLDDALAAAPSGTAGRHPLPSPAEFARALGELGVADDATVVAYDDRGGAFAGRLVWMLRILGQRAALLDGGIGAWVGHMDGDVEHGAVVTTPVERAVHQWPLDALADAIDVAKHLADDGVVIDSRDPARYAGEIEPIDSVAGHVPGAVNLLFNENLDADGRFRSADDLRARFGPVVERRRSTHRLLRLGRHRVPQRTGDGARRTGLASRRTSGRGRGGRRTRTDRWQPVPHRDRRTAVSTSR